MRAATWVRGALFVLLVASCTRSTTGLDGGGVGPGPADGGDAAEVGVREDAGDSGVACAQGGQCSEPSSCTGAACVQCGSLAWQRGFSTCTCRAGAFACNTSPCEPFNVTYEDRDCTRPRPIGAEPAEPDSGVDGGPDLGPDLGVPSCPPPLGSLGCPLRYPDGVQLICEERFGRIVPREPAPDDCNGQRALFQRGWGWNSCCYDPSGALVGELQTTDLPGPCVMTNYRISGQGCCMRSSSWGDQVCADAGVGRPDASPDDTGSTAGDR